MSGTTPSLSTLHALPSQILFTPDGTKIIVSENTTNRLSVFHVNKNGTVTGPVINDSHGDGPFGSYFLSSGILLVTETGPDAFSSYSLSGNGILNVISGSVPTGQMATCWVTVTREERNAYATNTSSGTITIYCIESNGVLTFVRNISSTSTGTPTGMPMNIEVSKDGRYLYSLNGNQGTVSVFNIKDDGSLDILQVAASSYFPYFRS